MFAPMRIWRPWHRKINVNQKRYAVVSSITASAVPSLVMARGHRIETVPELPLVAWKGEVEDIRYINRKGPLIVYGTEGAKLVKAFRNIPGVEIANVERLNLLKLIPGGHLGRFVIWTKSAFEKLDSIYGSVDKVSEKKGYMLPRGKMENAELARILIRMRCSRL
ncbi:putative ribosomal protein L4/L1e [Helianthus debilis subsp. tardiflorus]